MCHFKPSPYTEMLTHIFILVAKENGKGHVNKSNLQKISSFTVPSVSVKQFGLFR